MILITGASGFLGSEILKVTGKGNAQTLNRHDADYSVDLKKEVPVFNMIFDVVIHAAGKAHTVPKTDHERKDFFDVNVKGTKNLLKGLEMSGLPKHFVFISTIAVYGLTEGVNISEKSPLLATDPYGLSKIQSEYLVEEWCKKMGILYTILRLPLLIGANPPGNLKRMINAIKKGYYFNIAGGCAKKSMVLINDVAKIIPVAALIGGVYNLTDGYHPTFYELSKLISNQANKKAPCNMPYLIAKILAFGGDLVGEKSPLNSDKLNKITTNLTFDDNKARTALAWKPTGVLEGFII